MIPTQPSIIIFLSIKSSTYNIGIFIVPFFRGNQYLGIEMSISNDFDVKQITEEIVSYLKNHPNAADTVEGITEWWLLSLRTNITTKLVQQALDFLVSKSEMKFKVNLSGKKVYSKMLSE